MQPDHTEPLRYKIHNADYELKSVQINAHPNPINAVVGRIRCIVFDG